jgi:glyoxylase-like metal-dependent hydrolase (beta-lactamase superfamily II)
MDIHPFFDEATSTLTYVVHDGGHAVVIDPVRDFDPRNARTSWASAQAVAGYLDERRLVVDYVIDTHAHADHMTGLPFFVERYGARTVTGSKIGAIQRIFRDVYDLGPDFPVDGRQFDVLLDEGDRLELGSLTVRALHTPGHTPAHMSWQVGDAVFLGDTLFAPDYGTARCDFPGGSAEQLWDSIQRLYAMPDGTRLYLCHDYRPNGRPVRPMSTVGEQKARNVQCDATVTRDAFVAFRCERDASLAAPALILPSLQVNIRAGALPEPAPNGVSYLRIPLDYLGRRRTPEVTP